MSKILTDTEIFMIGQKTRALEAGEGGYILPAAFARAIEQAVLQSEQVQALKRDKERLNWLANPENNIGNVQLPRACVERNPHSLRDAIDDAMESMLVMGLRRQ